MLNFCIKSLDSFLAFISRENNTNSDGTLVLDQQLQNPGLHGRRNIPSPVSGLGFITFSNKNHTPYNVVDSAAVKLPPMSPPAAVAKKDPRGIGFLDEVGGSVDGLMSCTESLGFESSDERRVDGDQVMERIASEERGSLRAGARKKGRRDGEARKFPPPLSSLNRDGRPNFFLRPVRKDGRLELTEVRIDRMEILHASRQDGRLRLDMVRDVADGEDDIEKEKVEEEKNGDNIGQEMEEEKFGGDNIMEEVEEEEKNENIVKEEEEGVREKWVFPAVKGGGGGDGFRRCHEVVSHHHHHHNLHHNLHAWGQHCLTIR